MHKTYEQLTVGDKATFERHITESEVKQFIDLTGDDNPLHVDADYAAKTSFKKPVVHGMLTASYISTMVGKYLPGPGALWISQNFEFCLPVRLGDTLTIHAEVTAKHLAHRAITLKTEVRNQHDQIILKGEGKVKMLQMNNETVKNNLADKKKITLITGASRGIGAATAAYLAKQGHQVVINYLKNHENAAKVRDEIKTAGGEAILYQADVRDINAVNDMINNIEAEFGMLTGLVCNASSNIIFKEFNTISWQDIQEHLDTQLKGTFNCIKAALPHFQTNKGGSTVIIGSISADNVPPAKLMGYSIAKTALHSLTKSLAVEYGPLGMRFNLISPGMTDTDLIENYPEKAKLMTIMQTPLRRLAKPNDIAQAIAFLLNDESSFISGENLRICGGQVML